MTLINRRQFSVLAAGAVATLTAGASPLLANEVKGLEFLAPSAPGSGYDQLARTMQAVLQEKHLASGVQVQNVAGGGGTVGLSQFITSRKRAPSILVFGFALMGGIITTKSAVTLDQVVPLARLMGEANVIVVPATSDIKTLADLVAKLKANPQAVSWAGGSIGGIDHVMVGLIAKAVGVDPTKVNYVVHAGGGEVLASTLGGHATVGISGFEEFRSQIEAGKLRALAISSGERMPGVDVPTLKEGGVDLAIMNWRGLAVHASTPEEERKALAGMIAAMVKTEEWKAALKKRGWLDTYLPPAEFAAFLKQEQVRVATALKDVGLSQ
ncbi:Bug family tripartite tricarboxylate transporter substrate binding protein [Ancylobacter oerskovii]|uniref:Bug family tripartite tricarboxylate transporter substrate binding protein n=1 Tax=Ancylobacter oerskovii TaxID=459519 RepID=A0ABW4YTW4_9HYPH|nr:tripartite tricarboxylate transporter substrate-binding protein [Ancylobacter oerskovii]MBS7543301.1 tripartite tricarboxylate transporter substrate binding protein [Ancylobacter oerskovii]